MTGFAGSVVSAGLALALVLACCSPVQARVWTAGSVVDTVINKPDRYKRYGMVTGGPIRVRFRVPRGMAVQPCPLCWTNNPGSEDSVTFSGLRFENSANGSCWTELYPLPLRRSMSRRLMEVVKSPDAWTLGGYGRAQGATWWTQLDAADPGRTTQAHFLRWHSSKLAVTSHVFFTRRWFQELSLFVSEDCHIEPLKELAHTLEMLPAKR